MWYLGDYDLDNPELSMSKLFEQYDIPIETRISEDTRVLLDSDSRIIITEKKGEAPVYHDDFTNADYSSIEDLYLARARKKAEMF
jgi:hypothetical protein